jgi:hypothetical protein
MEGEDCLVLIRATSVTDVSFSEVTCAALRPRQDLVVRGTGQEEAGECFAWSHTSEEGVQVYHNLDTSSHVNVVSGRLCGTGLVVAVGSFLDAPELWQAWTCGARDLTPSVSQNATHPSMLVGNGGVIVSKKARRAKEQEEVPPPELVEERCEDEEDEEVYEAAFDDEVEKGVDTIDE